ncbi:MAG: hypothetical protein Ta2D_09420 [Rickettsiales bacterium]|nr:MAG: hypothetical protein Ta2D_09420 [Rickettsiales bacterium]
MQKVIKIRKKSNKKEHKCENEHCDCHNVDIVDKIKEEEYKKRLEKLFEEDTEFEKEVDNFLKNKN